VLKKPEDGVADQVVVEVIGVLRRDDETHPAIFHVREAPVDLAPHCGVSHHAVPLGHGAGHPGKGGMAGNGAESDGHPTAARLGFPAAASAPIFDWPSVAYQYQALPAEDIPADVAYLLGSIAREKLHSGSPPLFDAAGTCGCWSP
jgi:hypothetical protein